MTAGAAQVNEYGQPIGAPVRGFTPRPVPEAVDLVGSEVRVRSLCPDDVPGLFTALCQPGTEAEWTYLSIDRPADEAGLAAHLATLSGRPDTHPVVICENPGGRVLGTASYLRIDAAAGSIEVGAIHFGPLLRRTRGATEAMTLMARHAFDVLGYRRYEWKCDSLNAASRSAALRLGFSFEGIFRNALVTKGRNRDTAWFAMTDDDWRVLGPVHARWLAETSDGAPQAHSLRELTAAALARR